jgi:hypothetical protein
VRKASPVRDPASFQVHISNALYLRKRVLRGALTNGRDWIFLLIKLADDYDGASYKQSAVVQLRTTKSFDGQPVIPKPWPDLIAAILSYWVSLVQICAIELSTDRDARLKIALQSLEVMIGLNWYKRECAVYMYNVQCCIVTILFVEVSTLYGVETVSVVANVSTVTVKDLRSGEKGDCQSQSYLPFVRDRRRLSAAAVVVIAVVIVTVGVMAIVQSCL